MNTVLFDRTLKCAVAALLFGLVSSSLLAADDLTTPSTQIAAPVSHNATAILKRSPVYADGMPKGVEIPDGDKLPAGTYASGFGAAAVASDGTVVAVCKPEVLRDRAEDSSDISCKMTPQ